LATKKPDWWLEGCSAVRMARSGVGFQDGTCSRWPAFWLLYGDLLLNNEARFEMARTPEGYESFQGFQ
jgi:hypothetical protein